MRATADFVKPGISAASLPACCTGRSKSLSLARFQGWENRLCLLVGQVVCRYKSRKCVSSHLCRQPMCKEMGREVKWFLKGPKSRMEWNLYFWYQECNAIVRFQPFAHFSYQSLVPTIEEVSCLLSWMDHPAWSNHWNHVPRSSSKLKFFKHITHKHTHTQVTKLRLPIY